MHSAWGWLHDSAAFDAASGCTGLCAADACRRGCVAVHAGLQTAVGTLLPLAVIWALEESSRLRFQRAWLQQYVLAGGSNDSSGSRRRGGDSSRGAADAAEPSEGSPEATAAALTARPLPGELVMHRPLPLFALAAWLLAACSVVWAVLLGLVG